MVAVALRGCHGLVPPLIELESHLSPLPPATVLGARWTPWGERLLADWDEKCIFSKGTGIPNRGRGSRAFYPQTVGDLAQTFIRHGDGHSLLPRAADALWFTPEPMPLWGERCPSLYIAVPAHQCFPSPQPARFTGELADMVTSGGG